MRRAGAWANPAWLRRALDETRRRSKIFRRNVAILITLASVVAAAAAWRAEDRARIAEERDREGFAQDVSLQKARAIVLSDLNDTVVAYASARSARAQAAALGEQAALAQPDDAARLRTLAAAEDDRAGGILENISQDAFVRGSDPPAITAGSLDRKLQLDLAFRKTAEDLDSKPEFDAANRSFSKSDVDVGLAGLAIAAAFFFTIAQISRTRAIFFFLASGLLALAGSVVALTVVELL